jgi:hypothetical protein
MVFEAIFRDGASTIPWAVQKKSGTGETICPIRRITLHRRISPMKLGLMLAVFTGLLVTPMFAVQQDTRRDSQWDSRYELRRSMDRLRAELRRKAAEIRREAYQFRIDANRARMDGYRARADARRTIAEVRWERMEAVRDAHREIRQSAQEIRREARRAHEETRREVLQLRRSFPNW